MDNYLKSNYHTHTTRCKHAVGEDRAYVEAAIAAGITELGFSDHIPMPTTDKRVNSIRMLFSEVDDYMDSLLSLKREYRKDITIKVGFEGEYFAPVFQEQMELLQQYPYDYLILGQHFIEVDGKGGYSGYESKDKRWLTTYVDTCIEALETGKYRYLCHPDLIRFTGEEAFWEKEMRRLCVYCKEHGYPLEYNLLGALEQRHYPSHRFFALAGEVGNDIILGIDAHAPEQIGKKEPYQQALDVIDRYHLTVIDAI
ncbi:MAG: histidinol-phosphatase [Lachnospiraceae bacterium]|nr:histidinol-phosphatase [Lachnospiraceae bacterium]